MNERQNKYKEDKARYYIQKPSFVHKVLRKVSILSRFEFKVIRYYFCCLSIYVVFCLHLSQSQGPLCLWSGPHETPPLLPVWVTLCVHVLALGVRSCLSHSL